jgi:hypothetical protein
MERPEIIDRHRFQIDLLHRHIAALHFVLMIVNVILPGQLFCKWLAAPFRNEKLLSAGKENKKYLVMSVIWIIVH